MPDSGYYTKGEWIDNINPSEQGNPGSKYVVLGWRRLTTGSNHVPGVDWLEARAMTGN
ncbi:MAG: hypothetical protein V2A73_22030 [Pseudomonadota bacterium]